MRTFLEDLRYSLRMLSRTPRFTAVAALILTVGIGATTAIFSVVDAVLLHAPPYQSPTQLVAISERDPQGEENGVSVGDFADWQEQSRVFQSLAAYQQWEFHTLTGVGEPDEVWAWPVSANIFRSLGVSAVLGRTFVSSETQSVVLGYQYWRSHFFSDRAILGKTLTIDGKPYAVVGVAPADFEFPAPNAQLWIPLNLSADRNDHEHHSISVIARLKPGVALKQAQAELDTFARRLAVEYPKTNAGWSARIEPLRGHEATGVLRGAVFALLGAAVFVLMMVCANVTCMLLARGATRRSEMAVRAALGASRSRLVRQLLVESLLLAGLASAAGVALASAGITIIVNLVPKYSLIETQAVHRIRINLPVLGFTAAMAVLTGIVVGLLPALRVSGLSLSDALKQRGWTGETRGRRSSLQRVLVVSEVALALILMVGAGLTIQSFRRLETAPTGFSSDHLLTVRVPLARYKHAEGPESANFYSEVLQRIEAIPGVKAAGMANNLPFTGFHTTGVVYLPPTSPGGPGRRLGFTLRGVSPGYFRAMGIPLKEGRDFTMADAESNASCVRIVNEAMAHRFWGRDDVVGKQLEGACPKNAPALIVGVVADSKQNSVDSQVEPELYEPYAQHPFASFIVTFVIRTSSNPLDLAAAVRNAVWQVDHDQPVIQMRTMQNVILESIWRQHFCASMLGIFGLIALSLSAVGIYGLLAYTVSRRTHEIGIRTALGATQDDILRLVVGEGLILTLIGVGAGILAALGLARLLVGLLYGTPPRDLLTFVVLSLLLTAVGLLAAYIPARRATKVDPMVALRYE